MSASHVHTVLVSPDIIGPIRNGGIGTFIWHFAQLLRSTDQRVTVVYTGDPEPNAPRGWQERYRECGIGLREVRGEARVTGGPANHPALNRADLVAPQLPVDADIIYLQDWRASGFYIARQRRYQAQRLPVLVNILHSPSVWVREGMERFPTDPRYDVSLDFAEQYTAEHSDYVVSPSQYMLTWAAERGWKLPGTPQALGLPFLSTPRTARNATPGAPIREIIYFGRIETRKGLEIFVDSMLQLQQKSPQFQNGIERISFVGKPGEHRYKDLNGVAEALIPTLKETYFYTDLDTAQAQMYLAEAANALVVVPSRTDNFPYAAVEASRLHGLNVLYADVGGIPEIIGPDHPEQLFVPQVASLTRVIAHALTRGVRGPAELARYDAEAANARWIAFHERVCSDAQQRRVKPVSKLAVESARPLIDVCIAHRNHGRYLPAALESLTAQGAAPFSVTIVDDGSDDPESVRVFAELEAQYATKGWRFLRQPNGGASKARNHATQQGEAPYIVFFDSDNIARPPMLARLLDGIQNSGADCLTCAFDGFDGVGLPSATNWLYTLMPLGAALEHGLFSNTFGDTNFIIKRAVFDAMNGFVLQMPGERYLGYEDYTFLARLTLGGYDLDVIPDSLFHYRHLPKSMVRITNRFASQMRVIRLYRNRLQSIGLGGLAALAFGMAQQQPSDVGEMQRHNPVWVAENIPYYVLWEAIQIKIRKNLRAVRRRASNRISKR